MRPWWDSASRWALRRLRPSAAGSLPNVFAALEQQLGLKLMPGKGPVEVLVIDHAERPAEK